jgi:2-methylaconitate cis-trans-isomerase PrpF
MGSPDRYGRQLDGMGAGISSLSKICLVERARRMRNVPQGTIDYTFVSMGIDSDELDVAGNCGNMISAVGPYAYNAGLLRDKCYSTHHRRVIVTIRNTNTEQLVRSTFTTVHGQAAVRGDCAIDGVAGTGSPIKLKFLSPSGSKTGVLLPTKVAAQRILGVRVSCIDGATACVFVHADEIGIDGTILPDDFNKQSQSLRKLEAIRKAAAVEMGLAPSLETVARTVPKIGIVSLPKEHCVLSGETIMPSDVDLVVRFISDGQPHRAIPLTAALTTAVAARVEGSVVASLLATQPAKSGVVTIGHASGKIEVDAKVNTESPPVAESATVWRTARRIFEGNLFFTPDNDGAFAGLVASRYAIRLGKGEAFVKSLRQQQRKAAERSGNPQSGQGEVPKGSRVWNTKVLAPSDRRIRRVLARVRSRLET